MQFHTAIKIITVLLLLFFTSTANAMDDKELVRGMIKMLRDNNQNCEYNKTCCKERLVKIDKKMDLLNSVYRNHQNAIAVLNKIDAYLNSSEARPETLKELIVKVDKWKKGNAQYENDPAVSYFLFSLSALDDCISNAIEKDTKIISWVRSVLGSKNIDSISKLITDSAVEQANEKTQIEANNAIIERNAAKIIEYTEVVEGTAEYAKRDYTSDGIKFAKDAAKSYEEAAKATNDISKKAELLLGQSKALYFVGNALTGIEEKKEFFSSAKHVALMATKYLEKRPGEVARLDNDDGVLLARLYYWYIESSYGLYRNGWEAGFSSLTPIELEEYITHIFNLGQERVEGFGGKRLRAKIGLSRLFGYSYKTALPFYKEAFNETLCDAGDISDHGQNVLYYADVLIRIGGKENNERAKTILNAFVNKGKSLESLIKYNKDRIPETRKEINEAKNILSNIRDY